MSLDPNGSGGADPGSGGTGDKETPNNQPNPKDSVSYDSFQKLLDEKKSLAKRLEVLEAGAKERAEKELKEKEDYKKLLELREKELEEERTSHGSLKKQLDDSRKMGAFLKQVSGKVDEQYWALIDLDDVVVDPATGVPDDASIKKAVKEFEKRYPDVIKPLNGARMPNDPAHNPGAKLTYAEWSKLPYDEQRKRMKDVAD